MSLISRTFLLRFHSLNSDKVSIQIQLKALPELSEWTLHAFVRLFCSEQIRTLSDDLLQDVGNWRNGCRKKIFRINEFKGSEPIHS